MPAVLVSAALLLTAGCAGSSGGASPASAVSEARAAAAAKATASSGGAAGPSAAAQMICSDEIHAAVTTTFGLTATPQSTSSWTGQTYRCAYDLDAAVLDLAVQDADDVDAGRAYFDGLRARWARERPVEDFDSLGFPAYQTTDGRLALIKDGKTLRVDASAITGSSLPRGYDRSGVAYAIAAAVITCWTE